MLVLTWSIFPGPDHIFDSEQIATSLRIVHLPNQPLYNMHGTFVMFTFVGNNQSLDSKFPALASNLVCTYTRSYS